MKTELLKCLVKIQNLYRWWTVIKNGLPEVCTCLWITEHRKSQPYCQKIHNFCLQSNGKVIFQKLCSELVDYLQRGTPFFPFGTELWKFPNHLYKFHLEPFLTEWVGRNAWKMNGKQNLIPLVGDFGNCLPGFPIMQWTHRLDFSCNWYAPNTNVTVAIRSTLATCYIETWKSILCILFLLLQIRVVPADNSCLFASVR